MVNDHQSSAKQRGDPAGGGIIYGRSICGVHCEVTENPLQMSSSDRSLIQELERTVEPTKQAVLGLSFTYSLTFCIQER